MYGQQKAMQMAQTEWSWGVWIFIGLFVVIALVAAWMAIYPMWRVWADKKRGEATLAEANYAQQVAIADARARKEAATLNKEAEIIDAQAVAISVETIGKALHNNEGYLRWQWIKMMGYTESDVIYVPTEAGLPILEAGKRIVREIDVEE